MTTKVYTYGTRGMIEEWSTLRKYHSCTVVSVGGVKICIDCGSPALFRNVLSSDALVISHCFDEETEIFTDRGWKKFPELSGLDQVATLDDEGFLTFEKPVDYIEQDYVGPMYYLDTDFVNMMVTPNHKLYTVVNPRDFDHSAFTPVLAGGDSQRRTVPFIIKQVRRNNRRLERLIRGKRCIRRQRYKFQCGDLVRYDNKLWRVRSGMMVGCVSLVDENGQLKYPSTKRVELVCHGKGLSW